MASNRNSVPCPDCGGKVRTITSRLLSDGVREIYFDCCNVECMCRFVAHLGVVRVLVDALPRDTFAMTERRPATDILVTREQAPTPSTVSASPPPGDAELPFAPRAHH